VSLTPIYIGAGHDAKLTGMADDTGAYLNSGTATYTLVDEHGTQIATGPLSYVAGSSGDYLGVVGRSATITLTERAVYFLYFIFNQGDFDDEQRLRLVARYRDEG